MLACSSILAQAPTGTISGIVTDASGAVVPSANVTITDKATSNARTIATNAEGLYSAPALLAGDYEVRIELQGFKTVVRDASVLAGSTTTVNIALALGESKEVVTVEAAGAQINYENETVQGSVERQTIQELPLNGRSFTQLATLEPGVTVAAGATSSRNSPISVSVLGGGGTTLLTLDGLKIMDEYDGTGTQINFSQEMVQEFQLSEVNFDISTGITSTGAVNIVSRSGSNDVHGSAFFYYRDHNIAAYPGLQRSTLNPNPYFVRKDPGFWVGGPIKKDRLFFFFDYEYQTQVQAVTENVGVASFAPIAGIFESPQTYRSLNARLDYRLSAANSIFLRYTHDGNTTFGANGVGEPSNWLDNDNWSDQSAFGLTTTFSPNVVNDLRFGYNYWRSNNPPATAAQCPGPCIGTGLPPTYVIGASPTFSIGNNYNAPQNRIQRNLNLTDNLSWQKGQHRIRFGSDLEWSWYFFNWSFCDPGCLGVVAPELATSLSAAAGGLNALFPGIALSISSSAQVLQLPALNTAPSLYGGIGVGSSVTPGPYNFGPDRRNLRPRFYAQDTWKVKENLTINYGLGYEFESGLFDSDLRKPQFLAPIFGQSNLNPTPPNYLDFAPSFGFAWALDKQGKTVIRGGAGLYWDTIPIYFRSRENGEIGAVGNGRVSVAASSFTNIFPNIVDISKGYVPVPMGAPVPATDFTNMTLAQFLQIYNQQIGNLESKIAVPPPSSGSYTRTDLDYLKSGDGIFPSKYPLTRSYQSSIGVQRDPGHNLVVTADWARRQFENTYLGEIDVNHFSAKAGPVIPACTPAQFFDPTQECSTGPISLYEPEGRSIYEGLLVKATKRFSNRYQFTASYALQNVNSVGAIYNLNNWFANYGPALARNNFNVSGLVNLPLGFELTFNSSVISRPPFGPVLSGTDLNGTGITTSALPGLPYNCLNISCGRGEFLAAVTAYSPKIAASLPANFHFGDSSISQDFRLGKRFSYRERYNLAVFGEVFNAFNVANLTGYSSILGASFGLPTARAGKSFLSGGPRAFQFGARLNF